MRIRAILISSAAALAAILGTAGGASAATLFTSTAHTTPVTVGTTASIVSTAPWTYTSATSLINTCNTSTLGLSVVQNSGGTVVANVNSGSISGCSPLPFTFIFNTPWRLTVSGTATTVGDVTRWTASLTNFAFLLAGGTYSGNIETGLTARQTGGNGHMCLDFDDAGTFTGPLTSNGRIDTSYCFEGAASAWSLG